MSNGKMKFSLQRQAIKDYLMTHQNHPTADTVYQHVREDYPNISLATVYRNLKLLSECGEALALSLGDGIVHFDGNTQPHSHCICRQCRNVFDLEMDSFDHINTLAAAAFPGTIEGHVTYFYGICSDCKTPEEETAGKTPADME